MLSFHDRLKVGIKEWTILMLSYLVGTLISNIRDKKHASKASTKIHKPIQGGHKQRYEWVDVYITIIIPKSKCCVCCHKDSL